MAPKKAVAKKTIPAAPRGFFRGPLPLPGRTPVSLEAYRQAAIRGCEVKHRDQARDKWVLARNRRAQLSAGYIPTGFEQIQQQYPLIEGQYSQAPLQITAPPLADFGYPALSIPAQQGYQTTSASYGPQVLQSAPAYSTSQTPVYGTQFYQPTPLFSNVPLSYGAQPSFPFGAAEGGQFYQNTPASFTYNVGEGGQFIQSTPAPFPGAYTSAYTPGLSAAYTPGYPTTLQ